MALGQRHFAAAVGDADAKAADHEFALVPLYRHYWLLQLVAVFLGVLQ